jgi:hypothetical protein
MERLIALHFKLPLQHRASLTKIIQTYQLDYILKFLKPQDVLFYLFVIIKESEMLIWNKNVATNSG